MSSNDPSQSAPSPKGTKMSRAEFIGLMAMMFAMIAFSVDAMLPVLGHIAEELTPNEVNKAQLVISSFMFGMGLATLFSGPISDSLGRRPVVLAGIALYIVGAACASIAPSLEWLMLARFVQGLGVAGPRIVGLSIIRDLYAGRDMAKITSFVMMIFTIVPALAPSVGALISSFGGWRAIFLAFIVFGAAVAFWFATRQVETLPPEKRRPFKAVSLLSAAKEVFNNRVVLVCIAVMTLTFGILLSFINSAQQVYETVFHRLDTFPYWFAFVALVSASSSMVNARFVGRLGMRYIVRVTLFAQSILSGILILALSFGVGAMDNDSLMFGLFIFWQLSVFYMLGMIMGNLNALALEPMGHIAGMAASITGAVSTVLGLLCAVPVGLMFNGTLWPLACAVFCFSALALFAMRFLPERAE